MKVMRRLFGHLPPEQEEEPIGEPTIDDYPDYRSDIPPVTTAFSSPTVGILYRAEPRTFEDAGPIADCLKQGHPVVVSLEQADQSEAQRIRDFLRGAAYALGGDVRKVASRVYACVPSRVTYERLLTRSEEPASHLGTSTSDPDF